MIVVMALARARQFVATVRRMYRVIRRELSPVYVRPTLPTDRLFGDAPPRLGYGWSAMTPVEFATKINKAVDRFEQIASELNVDTIAFTGSSGAAIAFNIASRCDVNLVYVRKEGEQSHGMSVEIMAQQRCHRYLIVDDFICSGRTIQTVHAKLSIHAAHNHKSYQSISTRGLPYTAPVCVGILLFSADEWRTGFPLHDAYDLDGTPSDTANQYKVPVFG